MISNILVSGAGVVVFLFIFWRRLKEDYAKESIFTAAFWILGGLSVGFILTIWLAGLFWFWFCLVGALTGLLAAVWRLRLRFYETLETTAISLLPWLSLTFLNYAIEKVNLPAFVAFCTLCGLIALFHLIDIHYKSFAWYPSGRIGFAGLATILVFFTLRLSLANFVGPMLSFAGGYEAVLSLIACGVTALLLFFLSRVKK